MLYPITLVVYALLCLACVVALGAAFRTGVAPNKGIATILDKRAAGRNSHPLEAEATTQAPPTTHRLHTSQASRPYPDT